MRTASRKIELVEWQLSHTTVDTPGAKLFALTLCMQFNEGQESLNITDEQIAKIANISTRSVATYNKMLVSSGEWDITGFRATGTIYSPLFDKPQSLPI